jgi:peptidoglycan/LPS O-acetylase OafA/YrhL
MTAAGDLSDTRTNLPSLTGLRFIAAMCVLFYHSTLPASPLAPHGPLNPFADKDVAKGYGFVLGDAGPIGVSFFFVLSGFVLTWSSKPGERARYFLRRRAVKVFPNHAVLWAVSMALFAWASGGPIGWFSNLLLVHDFFPQPGINLGVNPPSWSLCSELLFYASFPFLIQLLRRIPVRHLWFWAAGTVVAVFAIELFTQFLLPAGTTSSMNPIPDVKFWIGYLFPPTRLFEFVLGAVLALMVRAGRWPRIGIIPAGLLLLAAYVAALFAPIYYALFAITMLPLGIFVASVANADVHGRFTPFRNPVMLWLGNVSFAFYLCQGVTLFYVRGLFSDTTFSTGMGVLVLLGLFSLTLLAGWLLHITVEQPMMRRWARPRPPDPEPPVAYATTGPRGHHDTA